MPSVSSPSGTLVPAVVERREPGPVLGELPLEQVVVGGLAGEAVSVLGQHHGDAACGHQVPYAVHARPLQARPALAGVR